MMTNSVSIAWAAMGGGPAIDAACEYADDSSVSATKVVPAQRLAGHLPWKDFAVRACAWLLLVLGATSTWAATYRVGIGDDCGLEVPCFRPSSLTINVGDSVLFYNYAEEFFTGAHNVVADDGSFRCAKGCDGEGGDGTPLATAVCNASGLCVATPQNDWSFTRTFNVPGIVKYHDEVSKAAGVIIVNEPNAFAIGAGITGSWFNPAQNGHGFMIEVLPGAPMRLLVQWMTFAPRGGQAWVFAVGPIDGNRAVLEGIQTAGSGALFPPNFDSAHVNVQGWGTLTFNFSDCNHGHVDWTAAGAYSYYGSGGMDLTRLTLPAGLTCP